MRGKSLLQSKLFAFAYRRAAVLRSAPYAVLVHTVSSSCVSRRFGGASTAWWWTWTQTRTWPKKLDLGVSSINLRNCWNKVTMTEFRIKTKDRQYEGLGDNEKMWKGPFCFIQGADPQYGMIDDMGGKKPIGWQAEIELTRKAVAAINKMKPKPKFFVICGDLVHAFPGQDQREEQEADFLKEFAKVDPSIPLVCVCGNHDIGNTPTRKSIQNFRNKFGDDYFGFWAGGVRCLVLNSQLYEDASKVEELKKEQDIWLDAELEAAKSSDCKHLVLFQHIPWFLQTPEEENEYFNIDKDIRLPMLEKFRAAGVSTIFCGHYHRNAGGSYRGMEEVVTSAMGCPLKDGPAGFEIGGTSGLRVVKVHETRISHQYYGMDDIPATVDL